MAGPPDAHPRENRAAALLSVASNAALTVVKLVVGLVTGSVAVLSEAANSAGDLVASGIAFAGVRAAARPADADHPYGHEKSENLAAAVEGILVLAAGLAVAVEAIRRLASGAPAIDHIGLAIGVGGIAAAGMGVVADAWGLPTVMWLIVALAVPMVVLARTLPVTRAERRAQGAAAGAAAAARPTAAARPVTAPGSASPHP